MNESRMAAGVGEYDPNPAEGLTRSTSKEGSSMFADASEFAAMLDEAADPNEGVNPRLADWESGKRRSKKGRR